MKYSTIKLFEFYQQTDNTFRKSIGFCTILKVSEMRFGVDFYAPSNLRFLYTVR